jgi:hypothetical protein
MSKMIVCRHCQEPFPFQPGKRGYKDECPTCLIERPIEAAKQEKSKFEQYWAAKGMTKEQIANRVKATRLMFYKLKRLFGWSEDETQSEIDQFESNPKFGQH